jgi:hypothetical protein
MRRSQTDKWHAWFFRSHSREQLRAWTARMRFFRFYRAVGGHANDGDTLRCGLRVESEADLVALTGGLGIELRELSTDEPQPVVGRPYKLAEMRDLRHRMEPFPRYEQLGRVTLASVDCFAYVWGDRLEIQVCGAAGDPYEVGEDDVTNAVHIERLILPYASKVIPPPLDDRYCFRG